jgi:hypothetical protein
LPRGRRLVTLGDVARYIQELPEAEHQLDQAAVEALLLVVKHNGPTTFAPTTYSLAGLPAHSP